MISLTYGYKKPQTGDATSVWEGAIEDNTQRLNDHSHNGTDSVKLTSAAFTITTASALSANWVSQGSGTYKQTITMPVGMSYNDYNVSFRDSNTGDQLYLTCKKVSNTSFDVYINDNTLTLTLLYGA